MFLSISRQQAGQSIFSKLQFCNTWLICSYINDLFDLQTIF